MSEEKVNPTVQYFRTARGIAEQLASGYKEHNKELVIDVLTAGIARCYAIDLLACAKKGLPKNFVEEVNAAPKIIESTGFILKTNYANDICESAAKLGEQYGLTAENLTARGHGTYVAKEQGRSDNWQDTRRSRKAAQLSSIDAVLA